MHFQQQQNIVDILKIVIVSNLAFLYIWEIVPLILDYVI